MDRAVLKPTQNFVGNSLGFVKTKNSLVCFIPLQGFLFSYFPWFSKTLSKEH